MKDSDIKQSETKEKAKIENALQLYSVTESLNIRTAPSFAAAVVSGSPVKPGYLLATFPQSEVTADEIEWLKVIFGGSECYAAKQFLEKIAIKMTE